MGSGLDSARDHHDQGSQRADDGDHDQEFDQSEATAAPRVVSGHVGTNELGFHELNNFFGSLANRRSR